MTEIGIKYLGQQETERHNWAMEQLQRESQSETKRSNLAREAETFRSNLAMEDWRDRSLDETVRHNKVTEGQENTKIAEQIRHNMATEQETNRHNLFTENELYRHNTRTEGLTANYNRYWRIMQEGQLKELQRHNEETERQAKYATDLSNMSSSLRGLYAAHQMGYPDFEAGILTGLDNLLGSNTTSTALKLIGGTL